MHAKFAMDDAFDVFGDAPPPKPSTASDNTSTSLLSRASEHPHFTVCKSLWPDSSSSSSSAVDLTEEDDNLVQLMAAYASTHASACAQSLRKSRISYGRACAKALVAACDTLRPAQGVEKIDREAARTAPPLRLFY